MFSSPVRITYTNKGKLLSDVISYEWYILLSTSSLMFILQNILFWRLAWKYYIKIHTFDFKFLKRGWCIYYVNQSVNNEFSGFFNLIWRFILVWIFRRYFVYRYDTYLTSFLQHFSCVLPLSSNSRVHGELLAINLIYCLCK